MSRHVLHDRSEQIDATAKRGTSVAEDVAAAVDIVLKNAYFGFHPDSAAHRPGVSDEHIHMRPHSPLH
jgi:hypothetical protein